MKAAVPGYDKLHSSDVISEVDFLKKAQTGDILLFKGSDTGSKFVRTLTWSSYDHIGILFTCKNYFNQTKLKMLHCNTEGVNIRIWRGDLRKSCGPGAFYEKVVFRKVNFERTK